MLVHLEFAFGVISNTFTGVITSLEKKRGGVVLLNSEQALVSLGLFRPSLFLGDIKKSVPIEYTFGRFQRL